MSAALTLLGITLTQVQQIEAWYGARDALRATLIRVGLDEPYRWVCWVSLDPREPEAQRTARSGDEACVVELALATGGTREVALAMCEQLARERLRGLLLALVGPEAPSWLELGSEAPDDLPAGFTTRIERCSFTDADGRMERREMWALYQEGSRLGYYLTREGAVEVAHAWPTMGGEEMMPLEESDALAPIEAALSEPCS